MKHTFALLCLVASVGGCASQITTLHPMISLTQVERPASARERYGEQVIGRVESDSGLTRFSFEDQMIKALFLVESNQIAFDLENKTDHSIRLMWNEVTFVTPEGEPTPVMHVGTKFNECRNEKPAAVIPRGVSVSDIIIPCSHVRFGYSSWIQDPLIEGFITQVGPMFADSVVAAMQREQPGKKMSVLMPLQIEGVTNEYTFTFVVDSLFVRRPIPKADGH